MFTFTYPDATDEQKWEQIRLWRNDELAATDWTQLDDAPVDSAAWAAYRKALRDLPQTANNPNDIIWPKKPK